LINHNWDIIRRTMWNYVGIVRKSNRLILAKRRILDIQEEIEKHYRDYYISSGMIELRNICLVAMMIIEAAIERKESRGLHYIIDYPETKKEYQKWNIFERVLNKNELSAKLIGSVSVDD